jgi:protein phosphatase-4 regulatory subunit 3
LLIVEAEDTGPERGIEEGEGGFLKEELLLTARVERDDIYVRQQGESDQRHPLDLARQCSQSGLSGWSLTPDTLIVWTEPSTTLDIALSFQDAEGCEDIWQFIAEVQRHLNNLPGGLFVVSCSAN